jgi:AAA+ ATPase superfamily predicted ATPase
VRASLAREILLWKGESIVEDRLPASDWLNTFRLMRRTLGDQPAIAVFDEFPWAVEADPGLPSLLKNAWDNVFADSQLKLLIAGSHISAMEKLMHADAALFGRLEGKLHVRPFSFAQIAPFVQRYDPEKRLAVYAILGGVPDYLRRWNDAADLMPNIREIFLADTSPFRNEHTVLISDVLRRDSPDYESVLSAVGNGRHDLEAITLESGVDSTARASSTLAVLEEVRLIERRVRASVPLDWHAQARYARYHLADPFLQFYYRFVAPNRSRIAQELYAEIEPIFRSQLRGFVAYAWEALCRHWTLIQARNGGLPLSPEFVGSDWGPGYQADVVAITWQERQVLIGEAKWGDGLVDHQAWRDFMDSAGGVMNRLTAAEAQAVSRSRSARGTKAALKSEWRRHLILFARKGATAAVREAASAAQARIVTFAEVARDLETLPEKPIR